MGIEINWSTPRNIVREKLFGTYEEKNTFIDMSIYNSGNTEFNIFQRRDVYEMLNKLPCLIFFNYDKNDLLRDIEMHTGVSLKIGNLILSFDKDIDIAIDELKVISNKIQVVDIENIVFNDLKLVIASNDAMGGEGNNLGYVYISNDISHLLVG
jgi:hypothetical protein